MPAGRVRLVTLKRPSRWRNALYASTPTRRSGLPVRIASPTTRSGATKRLGIGISIGHEPRTTSGITSQRHPFGGAGAIGRSTYPRRREPENIPRYVYRRLLGHARLGRLGAGAI